MVDYILAGSFIYTRAHRERERERERERVIMFIFLVHSPLFFIPNF